MSVVTPNRPDCPRPFPSLRARDRRPPSSPQVVGIVLALAGVAFASREHQEGRTRVAAGVGLALLQRSDSAGTSFRCISPARPTSGGRRSFSGTTSFLLIAVAALALRSAVRLSRGDAAFMALVGLGDMLGNVLFAASASHGLVSVTSVLASLYPIVTVILARIVLREESPHSGSRRRGDARRSSPDLSGASSRQGLQRAARSSPARAGSTPTCRGGSTRRDPPRAAASGGARSSAGRGRRPPSGRRRTLVRRREPVDDRDARRIGERLEACGESPAAPASSGSTSGRSRGRAGWQLPSSTVFNVYHRRSSMKGGAHGGLLRRRLLQRRRMWMRLLLSCLFGHGRGQTPAMSRSDVEADVQDVAFLDDVGLALEPLLPCLAASACDPAATRSSQRITSQRMKPRAMSEWIVAAASSAVSPRGASTRAFPSRPR